MENTKLLTEAQIEAIEKVAELVRKCVEIIVELTGRIVKWVREVISKFTNPRVIHLATKHKKLRVRKKNIRRIVKWMRRFLRCNE